MAYIQHKSPFKKDPLTKGQKFVQKVTGFLAGNYFPAVKKANMEKARKRHAEKKEEEAMNKAMSSDKHDSSVDLYPKSPTKKLRKTTTGKDRHFLKAKEGAGMTEAGRAAYNKETGGDLKAPQPEGGSRRTSYCARSKGQMEMHNINCSKTPEKRICAARRRWKC